MTPRDKTGNPFKVGDKLAMSTEEVLSKLLLAEVKEVYTLQGPPRVVMAFQFTLPLLADGRCPVALAVKDSDATPAVVN